MISNCSGKRSFSALRRIKNHVRSSMGQKRLNSLALQLCIENELLERIDADDVRALHGLNPENVSFECVHTIKRLCLCVCALLQLWLVFTSTNRMKNMPLTII